MIAQGLKVLLGLALAATVLILLQTVDRSFSGGKGQRESAAELVLLPSSPDEPQRGIVIVHGLRVVDGVLTLDVELRNNSAEPLEGVIWGQALLGDGKRLVESITRQTYKARIKTFKTIRFALPDGAANDVARIEVLVLDESTGLVTKYGEKAEDLRPRPSES